MDLKDILNKQPILLFDGECGFCNRIVKFFLKRERKKIMHFVSLQSETAGQLRDYFGIDEKVDSMILIRDYSAYIKSCAALRLSLYMKGLWPVLIVFLIIPPFLRNFVYDLIAKRRVSLSGRVQNCALIPEEDRKRFL